MAMDPYSPCRCGSGKKVKFCCSHLLAEMNQLERMIDGEQYLAALKYLEGLETSMPPQACLFAYKLLLLRALKRPDESRAVVAAFLQQFPDNPIALAESAVELAIGGDCAGAVNRLQQVLATVELQPDDHVYEVVGVIAQMLLHHGEIRAGRALLHLQMTTDREDSLPAEILTRLNQTPTIPLALKDDPTMAECPIGVPWKAEFDEAMASVPLGRWAFAAEKLTALAQRDGDLPAIWTNLAIMRDWLADRVGAVEALQKLARLDVPLEDAVEAELNAMLLSENPLGDRVDSLWLSFPVKEADQLAAIFSTWKQAVQTPVEPTALEDDDVPPKAAFWLLDRPTPDAPEDLTLDTMSCIMGRAMLFGRQTDREARLEVMGVDADNVDTLRAMLAAIAGDQLAGEPEREVLAQGSASREILQRPWRMPPGVTREQFDGLSKANLERALLETWPRMSLGLFQGKTPEEVASDPAQRIPLLAAIMLLEIWTEQAGDHFDFNRLRAKLGLPTLEPIELGNHSPWNIPLTRLSRIKVEGLSDEALRQGFFRATVFSAMDAVRLFGNTLIERPNLDGKDLRATLRILANAAETSDRALDYIERGRQSAEAAGESSAPWDLLELSARIGRPDTAETSRILNHIQREHINEPGVADSLREFFVRLGILNPDGTPAVAIPEAEAAPTPAESSGLWTPDGDAAGGEKPKLWMPGMD